MIILGKKLYEVLERCNDLFPHWKKEGDQYWNSRTGEIVTKDGVSMHDAVYRPPKEEEDWITCELNGEPCLDSENLSVVGPEKPEYLVTAGEQVLMNGSYIK